MKAINIAVLLFLLVATMPLGLASQQQITLDTSCFNQSAEKGLENYVPGEGPLRFLAKRTFERAASVEDAEARLLERRRQLWLEYCDANETGWVDEQTFDRCELDWAGSVKEDKDGSILIRVYAINCKIVRTLKKFL